MKKNILMLSLVLISSATFADNKHDDTPVLVKKVDQLVSDLSLSDEQKTKIQASRDKYKSQIMEKESAFNTAKDKFTSAIQNPNTTSADLETLYKKQEDAHRALQDVLFQSRMEFRDILTPEQRTKMVSKHEKGKTSMKTQTPTPAPLAVSSFGKEEVPPPAPVIK